MINDSVLDNFPTKRFHVLKMLELKDGKIHSRRSVEVDFTNGIIRYFLLSTLLAILKTAASTGEQLTEMIKSFHNSKLYLGFLVSQFPAMSIASSLLDTRMDKFTDQQNAMGFQATFCRVFTVGSSNTL